MNSTTKHAIKYLEQTKEEFNNTAATCYSAFKHVTENVTVPCRAIGVAKDSLRMFSWNVDKAINRLREQDGKEI